MRIEFETVECVSAFELAGATMRQKLPFAPGIELTTLPGVLFLPHALDKGQSICLVQERFVPLESILDCWNVDFFKRQRSRMPAAAYNGDFEIADRNEDACVLGNLFSRNFGHWTEELLKVAVLEKARWEGVYVIPALPPFAIESLRFLGIPEDRIATVDSPTRFAKASFTSAVSHETVASQPHVLALLRELVAGRLGDIPADRPRLWLDRKIMVRNGGGTANPEEVAALLARRGFETVDMGSLAFGDQLRLASGARIMAGVHGAQFVHAQFMQPTSVVIECFSPIHVNPSILQICRVLGHSYHQVVSRSHLVAPYDKGRDCTVDCEHLELILDALRA